MCPTSTTNHAHATTRTPSTLPLLATFGLMLTCLQHAFNMVVVAVVVTSSDTGLCCLRMQPTQHVRRKCSLRKVRRMQYNRTTLATTGVCVCTPLPSGGHRRGRGTQTHRHRHRRIDARGAHMERPTHRCPERMPVSKGSSNCTTAVTPSLHRHHCCAVIAAPAPLL